MRRLSLVPVIVLLLAGCTNNNSNTSKPPAATVALMQSASPRPSSSPPPSRTASPTRTPSPARATTSTLSPSPTPTPTAAATQTVTTSPTAVTTAVSVGSIVQVNTPGDCLLVRSRASLSGAKVDCRADGDSLRVTGTPVSTNGDAWLPVTAANGAVSGWVRASYVRAGTAAGTAPQASVVAAPTRAAPNGATPQCPRGFIPSPGNGGGPTLCKDGLCSNSSGPGTCSGHGGVAMRFGRRELKVA